MMTRTKSLCSGLLLVCGVGLVAFAGCGHAIGDDSPPDASTDEAGTDPADDEPDNDGVDDGGLPPTSSDDGGATIPTKIRYVLVLVKENHTFDNYFTGFPGAETATTAKLSSGKTITRAAAPSGPLAKDLCHQNSCGQTAYASGAMNGFDKNNGGSMDPFIHYTEAQIPNYWQYARNFVLADHLFSTVLGPSTPGHMVFWNAQSIVLNNAACQKDGGACSGFGCTAGADVKITQFNPDDCTTKLAAPCFDLPVITDHLPKGFTWADYGGALALMTKSVVADPTYSTHFRKQADLVTDLQQGHIANLTIAHLWSGDVSEHPAAYPCDGENFTVDIVNAAMKLPQWKEMAIVITWDDWGGFYDHVAPPVKTCKNGQTFQEGFRLPALVVSPYAKKGFVLKTPLEQASIPRLVEDLWGMQYMDKRDPHARDGTAGSMMDAFDFTQTARDPLLLTKQTCP